ncbi:LAFA_0G16468g1_1 [Lachancea sp. 'fantastica']|nr:LAFA_0G16468g1_1 [Lachancea sp. 'fantastica']
MRNDTDRLDLDPNVVVSELRCPVRLITSFLGNDETLLVVKNRELSVYSYLKNQELPVYRESTSETVLEAWSCNSGANSEEKYAIIFYESGEIEVRNEKLQIVDSAKLDLPYRSQSKPLVTVDAKFSRFFVSWDRLSVVKVGYKVDYKAGVANLQLSVLSEAKNVVFKSPHPIRALSACWNSVDSEEFYQMCILSQPRNSKVPTVEIWEELDLIRNKWKAVIKSRDLDDLPCDASCEAISLISRVNVGFMCFFPDYTLVYDARKAFLSQKPRLNTIKKNLKSILGLGLSDARIYLALEQSMQEDKHIAGCTNEGEFFKFDSRLLFDGIQDPNCVSLISPDFARAKLDTADNCIHLRGSQFLIPTTVFGLVIFDSSTKTSLSIASENESALYSTVSGEDGNFMRFLVSGGSSGNQGFLECTFLASEVSLNLSPIPHITDRPVADFWLAEKGLFWTDFDGILYNDTEPVTTGSNVVHVNSNGEWSRREDDIVMVGPIMFSQELVYVKKNGEISWGLNGLSSLVPGFENARSASRYVSSAQLPDASILTVVGWNSESVWFFDSKSKSVKLQGLSQICDCLVKTWENNSMLIFIDIFGNTQIYNTDGTMRSQFKISGHRFYLQDLPASNRFLICCVDSVFMVSFHTSKIEAGEVILPLRLKRIKVALGTTFIGMDADSTFYRADISELLTSPFTVTKKVYRDPSHIYTKHLALPISRRFVITSAVAQSYDSRQEKTAYESEIHVHDVSTGVVARRYAVSTLFPQALVSDLTDVTFNKRVLCGKYLDNNTSFAKQLIFARCFLVSLSFDFAEDESQDNLLLFTLDDETGEIELQLRTRVEFSVTSLYNYSNRILFAAGEFIQALQLDYSAKEGIFSLKSVSKALVLDGYAGYCFCFSKQVPKILASDDQPSSKRPKVFSQQEVIGVHSLVKGIQEFEVSAEVVGKISTGVLSSELKGITIKKQPVSDYSEVSHYLTDLRFSSDVKVDFNERRGFSIALSFAAINEDGHVSVMYSHQNDGMETLLGAQFASVPSVTGLGIVDISSGLQDRTKALSGLNRTYTQLREKFMPLFLLNTSTGGCYLVSTIISQEKLQEFLKASKSTASEIVGLLNCDEIHFFGPGHALAEEPKNCIFG